MKILALLPEIHHRPTGGNLFNRHLLGCLEEKVSVERRVVTGSSVHIETESSVHIETESDLTLVDSLLLAPAATLPLAMTGPKILLAHYLHLFEPGRQGSSEAHLERRHLQAFDGVITTSAYCRDTLLHEGFTASQLLTVKPGLSTLFGTATALRPPAPARLLTVASLLEGKGLDLLLEVLQTLQDLPWSWEIVGDPGLDPEFSKRFKRRVERSSIAERVHFHGAVGPEQVVIFYDHCHIFVLPSRFETCSMATMEAMARSLPVVAFRVGGLPEHFPPSTTHLLASPGDSSGLATILRFLLKDLEQAASLGSSNYRTSQKFPSWGESSRQVLQFIHRRMGAREQ